ncbi:MAG: response regulator [Desulfamplus sp.]|nr:response regulator [Desulfamplus sp.]
MVIVERSISILYTLAIMMAILLFPPGAINSYSQTKSVKILIFHSYHQGYEWNDSVHKGIIENLNTTDNTIIYTEHLDAQQNSSKEYLDLMEALYKNKYKSKQIFFDLIIVSDDNALQFLKAKKDIFETETETTPPIVFCGINNFDPKNFEGLTNYTGVNEQISVKETLELAFKLRPNAKKVAVVVGSSITEQRNLKIFQETISEVQIRLPLNYLNKLELDELKNRLKDYDIDDILIVLGPLLSTPSGKTYSVKETIESIKSSSEAAIFGFWDFMLPFGALGGKVNHGYSQGQWASRIATRILNGTPVSEIPVQMISPNKFVFNDAALEKYNISYKMLPPKSIIMNKTAKGLIKEWDAIAQNSFFGYEMFEKHGTMMWLSDPKTGIIIDANQAAIDYYGYPTLTGMRLSDINLLSPDDTFKLMQRARNGELNNFQLRHRLADGRIITVEIHTYPIKVSGNTILFAIINDITSKLEAEAAVKNRDSLVRAREVAIFFILLLAFLFQSALIFYLYQNIKKLKSAEERIKRSNDELRQLIKEREIAEEEREKLQGQLIQSQKMESVGRLAGGVAHDFNNMLGVILGHSELALHEVNTNNRLHQSLEEIRKAAKRSADLTRQLLAFARKQTAAPKVLNLNQTVDSMLKMLNRLIGENIELIWLPCENLWRVLIDPSQIDQILANLCVNAKDAIAGSGKVIIETKNITFESSDCVEQLKHTDIIITSNHEMRKDHEGCIQGDFVVLTVSDNGCGMDKDTLDRIFEPFFTTKDISKGTGLGLATVYGIVKQNSGFINVYSEPNGKNGGNSSGTTFTIYLPRYIDDNGAKIAPKDEAKPILHGYETILLVEDEPSLLEMTATMLKKLNYTVLAAGSPQRAIEIARDYDGKINLLMTDVVMPKMNGRELAIKLTSLYPDMRCLFMSGYTADVIAHHGVLDKSVHFIQKPFALKDIALKIRESLGQKES